MNLLSKLSTTLAACLIAAAAGAVMIDESKYTNPNGNTLVTIEADPTQSYNLYVPTTVPPGPRTILYGFDAVANNSKNLFLRLDDAARARGWILAVSNNSHNGQGLNALQDIQDKLLADTESRLNLNSSRRFATGFSGGSRVAMMLAGRHPDKLIGVLMMGAGDAQNYGGTGYNQLPLNQDAAVYGLIGRSDTNFSYGDLSSTQLTLFYDLVRCFVQPYNGGHVWPSAAAITTGTEWLEQNAGRGLAPNFEDCAPDTNFAQGAIVFSNGARTSDMNADYLVYQNIQGISGKVTAITWWGHNFRFVSDGPNATCVRTTEGFRISFLTSKDGLPDESVWAQNVTPERVYTGHVSYNYEMFRYRHEFAEPLDIGSAQWLRIACTTNDTCDWAWCGNFENEPASLQLTTANLGQPDAFEALEESRALCIETDAVIIEGGVDGEGEGLREGVGDGEGVMEGEGAIEGEGTADGEGLADGEGTSDGEPPVEYHSADVNEDAVLNLSELLRLIQLYALLSYHCNAASTGMDDGLTAGAGDNQTCPQSDADYAPADWSINLEELLRQVQLFNSGAYEACEGTEDGFCLQ